MSKPLTKEDILNAFINPVISRQVTQIIKQNNMGFVLEPILPEFAEKKAQTTKTIDSRWAPRVNPLLGTTSDAQTQQKESKPDQPRQEPEAEPAGKDIKTSEQTDSVARPADDFKTGGDVAKLDRTSDDKIWIVIKSGVKSGPFSSADLTQFLQNSQNHNQMLIKNNKENRILTVDYYLKEYLNNLDRKPEPRPISDVQQSGSESVAESDECSLEEDSKRAYARQANALPESLPSSGQRGKEQSPKEIERNLEIEELPRNQEFKPRGAPEQLQADPRVRYYDHGQQPQYSQYPGSTSYQSDRQNPYQANYRDYRMPQDMYQPRLPDERSDQQFEPKYQGQYSVSQDDNYEPQPPQLRYDQQIKAPLNQPPRSLNPIDSYRAAANMQYKQPEPANQVKKPSDYYTKPSPVGPIPGLRPPTNVQEPLTQNWGRKEYNEPQRDNQRPFANRPNPAAVLSEYNELKMQRPDVAMQRIEDDPSLDSINNPFHLISELSKRNQQIKNNQEALQSEALNVQKSQSDSMSLQKQIQYAGNSRGNSDISGAGQEDNPADNSIGTGEQSQGALLTRPEPKNALSAYMQNIRQINKQTTLDISLNSKDVQQPAPVTSNTQNSQPTNPSHMRPAKTETLASKNVLTSETDVKFISAQNLPNKNVSPVNSYLQNIMRANKKPNELLQQTQTSASSFQNNSQNMDFGTFPPVQQSRLQDNQPRNDVQEQPRIQAAGNGNGDNRDNRMNKYIEKVYSLDELKQAKKNMGSDALKFDNVFETDEIAIPPNYGDSAGPEGYRGQGQPHEESSSQKSLPRHKGGPYEGKKLPEGPGLPAFQQQQQRPRVMPQQPVGGYPGAMPAQGQRIQANMPPYGGFDSQNRYGQGYMPQETYGKAQGVPGGYLSPQYDQVYHSGQKFGQEYSGYRPPMNYGYQEFHGPPEYARSGPSDQSYPNRPYQTKEFSQYEYDANYDRNYQQRKTQYPVEHGYGYNQPPRQPADQFGGYKGEQRFNYQQQPGYQGYEESYNSYPSQRGPSHYDFPRGAQNMKYPVGGQGYGNEPVQSRFKGHTYQGKGIEESGFYDQSDDRGHQKHGQQKDSSYNKGNQNKNNRNRKGKKKESDAPYYQSKGGNQSPHDNGY